MAKPFLLAGTSRLKEFDAQAVANILWACGVLGCEANSSL